MKTRALILQHLRAKFPSLDSAQISDLASDNLFSDTEIELPKSILNQAQNMVKACSNLRHNPSYQQQLAGEQSQRDLIDPGNDSIAMSFDFHLNSEGVLKLIEVNTNAAFLALGDLFYEAKRIPRPIASFSLDRLRGCLEREARAIGLDEKNLKVAIIDEAPSSQRLYLEFLVYQQLFESWGWPTEILDSRSDLSKKNLIYNRDTDFFLEGPEKQSLRDFWKARKVCLSPHPYQYFCLADKQRLIDWQTPGFLQNCGVSAEDQLTIFKHLPWSQDLDATQADSIWAKRKTLFIKPKRSFGAKQSYRGGSISRKMFEELIPQGLMAQEFVPAPEVDVLTAEGLQKMKYDLRFYSYNGEVQSVMARIYQGQVTNLKTLGGGFACVRFI